MRRLFTRRAVAIAAAVISLTAIPATGIVAPAAPAFGSARAGTSSYECNTYGHMYCLDVPAPFGNASPVVLGASSGGRLIYGQDMGYTCCSGHEVYRIHFVADSSQCLGVSSSGLATVRDCSDGNSSQVNWAWVPGSVDGEWENATSRLYLVSDNTLGDQLSVAVPPCPNCYFTWTLIVVR